MLINNNYSYGYYYNQLTIEQKQQVNNICSDLGVSVGELEFYFGFIAISIGNISFFAFIFLLKKNPNLINSLRAQAAAMGFGAAGAAGISTPSYSSTPSYNLPTTPSSGGPNCSCPKQIGDAFLTVFSPKDLENLKNGEKLDLKNGVVDNLKELAKYDKNGDGKLTNDELKDLQITIDKNKDGKIDKDELKTAPDANIKEIDLKTGKVLTNDGKTFDIQRDNVKIGDENKNALIIDSNKDGKPTKDRDNKLQPGDFSQFGSKSSSSNTDTVNSSNTNAINNNSSSNSNTTNASSSVASSSGSSSSGSSSSTNSST